MTRALLSLLALSLVSASGRKKPDKPAAAARPDVKIETKDVKKGGELLTPEGFARCLPRRTDDAAFSFCSTLYDALNGLVDKASREPLPANLVELKGHVVEGKPEPPPFISTQPFASCEKFLREHYFGEADAESAMSPAHPHTKDVGDIVQVDKRDKVKNDGKDEVKRDKVSGEGKDKVGSVDVKKGEGKEQGKVGGTPYFYFGLAVFGHHSLQPPKDASHLIAVDDIIDEVLYWLGYLAWLPAHVPVEEVRRELRAISCSLLYRFVLNAAEARAALLHRGVSEERQRETKAVRQVRAALTRTLIANGRKALRVKQTVPAHILSSLALGSLASAAGSAYNVDAHTRDYTMLVFFNAIRVEQVRVFWEFCTRHFAPLVKQASADMDAQLAALDDAPISRTDAAHYRADIRQLAVTAAERMAQLGNRLRHLEEHHVAPLRAFLASFAAEAENKKCEKCDSEENKKCEKCAKCDISTAIADAEAKIRQLLAAVHAIKDEKAVPLVADFDEGIREADRAACRAAISRRHYRDLVEKRIPAFRSACLAVHDEFLEARDALEAFCAKARAPIRALLARLHANVQLKREELRKKSQQAGVSFVVSERPLKQKRRTNTKSKTSASKSKKVAVVEKKKKAKEKKVTATAQQSIVRARFVGSVRRREQPASQRLPPSAPFLSAAALGISTTRSQFFSESAAEGTPMSPEEQRELHGLVESSGGAHFEAQVFADGSMARLLGLYDSVRAALFSRRQNLRSMTTRP